MGRHLRKKERLCVCFEIYRIEALLHVCNGESLAYRGLKHHDVDWLLKQFRQALKLLKRRFIGQMPEFHLLRKDRKA